MRRTRVAAFTAIAVGLSLSVVGCAPSPLHGRSVDQASSAASVQPGVDDASVRLRNYRSGFTSEWGATVYFKPSTDFNDVDKTKLFRNLIRIAWSVDEHKLDNGVSLSVGNDSSVNLTDVAEGTDLPKFSSNPGLPFQITMSSDNVEKLFGAWPGRR
jgi:hypothetical protein